MALVVAAANVVVAVVVVVVVDWLLGNYSLLRCQVAASGRRSSSTDFRPHLGADMVADLHPQGVAFSYQNGMGTADCVRNLLPPVSALLRQVNCNTAHSSVLCQAHSHLRTWPEAAARRAALWKSRPLPVPASAAEHGRERVFWNPRSCCQGEGCHPSERVVTAALAER